MLFIVQLQIQDGHISDGYVEIIQSSTSLPILNIHSHRNIKDDSNITYFQKVITKNFAIVEFTNMDASDTKCIITNFPDSITIIFDSSSSSAYSEFKSKMEGYMNTTYETQYYPSGNISYIGNMITNDNTQLANGIGAVYYDSSNYMVKYFGEFENGMYDGKGTFYNKDSKIKLEFNTISNGIPINNGKLYFEYNKIGKKLIVDVNFNQFLDSMKFLSNDIKSSITIDSVPVGLDQKKTKQKLVASNNFVDIIASKYWKDPMSLAEVAFRDKNIDDKQIELYEKMEQVQLAITNKMKHNIDVLEQATLFINQSIMYTIFINILIFMLIILYFTFTK